MQHPNFYENAKEAEIRLHHTIVQYDGDFYYVLGISDHKGDGVLRIYLDYLGHPDGVALNRMGNIPMAGCNNYGDRMDEFLDSHPDSGVLRKMMTSPKFGKFRPFPLGMWNTEGEVYYLERQPVRNTQQGLTSSMITTYRLKPTSSEKIGSGNISLFDRSVYKTLKGDYPSASECVTNLADPDVTNVAAAFDRRFSFIRGPLNMLFLVYKTDIVGALPDNSLRSINIAPAFYFLKEVVQELNIFGDVNVMK